MSWCVQERKNTQMRVIVPSFDVFLRVFGLENSLLPCPSKRELHYEYTARSISFCAFINVISRPTYHHSPTASPTHPPTHPPSHSFIRSLTHSPTPTQPNPTQPNLTQPCLALSMGPQGSRRATCAAGPIRKR